MTFLRSSILIFFTLLSSQFLLAQTTTVKGTVVDAAMGESLPGAYIQFIGTQVGTATDLDGNFSLSTTLNVDSLKVSFFGFQSKVIAIQRGKEQTVKVKLDEQGAVQIGEAQVKAGPNPAAVLLDSVRAHRGQNDLKRVQSYETSAYIKTRFNLYNISEKFKNQKILKPIKFIFDKPDTLDGVPHYPILLSEVNSLIYKKQGQETKEVITGVRITGFENNQESFGQFLGSVYNEFNIYDDNQVVLGKSFMGPVSPIAETYYRLRLTDTMYVDNHRYYKVEFSPRISAELVYVGEMWIQDTSFAITSVKFKMNPQANINLIAGFQVEEEFYQTPSGQWAMRREDAILNFNPKDFVDFSMNLAPKNENFMISIFKTSYFDKYIFNKPVQSDTLRKAVGDITTLDGATSIPDSVWAQNRPVEFTDEDKNVDSTWIKLNKNGFWRFIKKVGDLVASGYVNLGYVGIGPVYEMYSYNRIEGHRIKIGGRTGDKLSRRMYAEGHVIYGTEDKRFKWDAQFYFHLKKNKNPWRFFGIRARQDVEQLGLNAGQFRPDNLLGTFLRRRALVDLTYINQVYAFYDHDWFAGLNQKLTVTWMQFYDTGTLRFGLKDPTTGQISSYLNDFTKFEIRLETTFSYGIKYIPGRTKRRPLRGKYPAVKLTYAVGIKDVMGSDYNYHLLKLSITDRLPIRPIGYGDWEISAGKIWGVLPYSLMEIHPGNDTYIFDPFGFNLMNYFEFVSDQYVMARYEHHFDGFFFNKIPGFSKLKWREVVGIKAVIGSISDANRNYMALPPNTYELKDQRSGKHIPYIEMNAGIENIFNIFRVDFLWRLTHRRQADPNNPGKELYPQSINWGIMAGISLKI